MLQGLWTVAFSTRAGAGYGVVLFGEGRMAGGDSGFYWTGDYRIENGTLRGRLTFKSHSGQPHPSILGPSIREQTIEVSAAIPASMEVGANFTITGPAGFNARLTRRE